MKPPVEHVKVSAKGRDILIKVKRNTGLEHWNEICRVALCRSLTNPTPPPSRPKTGDSNIDMDWKTFSGQFQDEFSALVKLKAKSHGVDVENSSLLYEYFRNHLERGISLLRDIKQLNNLY